MVTQTYQDPRSRTGSFSRGTNIYNGGTNNAHRGSGNPNMGRPVENRLFNNGPSAPTSNLHTTERQMLIGAAPNTFGNRPPGGSGSGGVQAPDVEPPPGNPVTNTTSLPQAPPGGTPVDSTGVAPVAPIDTDAQLQLAEAQYQRDLENLQTYRDAEEERINLQLNAIMERLGLLQTDTLEDDRERLATNNMLRSGIAKNSQTDIAEDFAQQGADVGMQASDALSQLETQFTDRLTQLEDMLSQALISFAQRAERDAAERAAAAAAAQESGEQNQSFARINTSPTGQITMSPYDGQGNLNTALFERLYGGR